MKVLPGMGAVCAARICLAGLMLGLPWQVSAELSDWRNESYLSYSTGDYGEDENSEMLYWPLVVRRDVAWGDVSVTVPYVRISAPAGQVLIDGSFEGAGEAGSAGTETQSGLGDVILKARYQLKEADARWPWVDGFAKIKLPTADEDEGLGTGEADIGFGLESVKILDGGYLAFLDVGYTFIGDPRGVDYDNRVMISPGIGRSCTAELMLAAFYEWRNAIGSGEDPHTLSFLANYKWSSRLQGFGMLDIGLSEGAGDFGLTAGVRWRW